MQEFLLDEHCSLCRDREYCTMKDKFIFFAYNEFFMVNHYMCLTQHNRYDFYQDLIKRVIDKIKIAEKYGKIYDNSRRKYDDYIVSLRKDAKLLKKNLYDIHYEYSDNAGKPYCIYSEIPFFDKLCNDDLTYKNYRKAIDYVKSKGYRECYEEEIHSLYISNMIPYDDRLVVRTTDDLIKHLNQLINEKQTNYAK